MESQMPVEECGNMIIMTAAVCRAEQNVLFAGEHRDLLSRWVAYLLGHWMDPGSQLSTDDFAGHLAHNANLSIKAIVALACYGWLWGRLAEDGGAEELRGEAARYAKHAKEMARRWVELADDGARCRLAFFQPRTWSLKYNLIWDRLFGFGLFDEEVFRHETSSRVPLTDWYFTDTARQD